eukprot:c19559_g1_i3 orf=146-817(+)
MSTLSRTERGHQKYREGRYEEALELYTHALSAAKYTAHRIALYSNRAACYLKLKNFRKAVEECSAVLELNAKHTGALMLRAQTLVAMKDYHSALFDVNRLTEINPSSDVYCTLQARLRKRLLLAPIPEAEDEMPAVEELKDSHSMTSSSSAPSLLSKATSASVIRGWDAIPKPKGHSELNYSHWDALVSELSDEEEAEEEDENSLPQFKFRLKTVGLQTVDQR